MSVATTAMLTPGRAPVERPALEKQQVAAGALGEAFTLCRDITRARARNFYYGMRLTPEPKRSALYAIYAWMREADDIADDEGTGEARVVRLERFERNTHRVFEGGVPDAEAWWLAFGATYEAFGLEPSPFVHTLDGVRADIEHGAHAGALVPTYADRDGLVGYCERVASTVGVLCLRIWGVAEGADWAQAHRLALQRGVAFQLTNILRDIEEDADDGRCYLPADLLERHGLDASALVGWERPDACARAIGEVVGWAHEAYRASAPLDAMVHPDGRRAMGAMTRIYAGLLDRIEREPERCALGPRVRLSCFTKTRIALSTMFGGGGA